MNKDLLLAILSMDSYNRGYDQGVILNKGDSTTNQKEAGRNLGNVTILNIDLPTGSAAAGFYALAYTVSGVAGIADGSTVIAYRGTDANLVSPFGPVGSDLVNGYGLALSAYGAPQVQLALQFYKAVSGADHGADPFASNITLTGHSLGGGLAGFVGDLYGLKGVLFNNMPFEVGAAHAYLDALVDPATKALLYGTVQSRNPNEANLDAFATTGEFLGSARGLQSLRVHYLDSHGSARSPLDLHSVALNVALQYVKANGLTAWIGAAPELWDAFFDEAVAKSLPTIGTFKGATSLTDVMDKAIAYSALGDGTSSEGAMVFGDTAIWSMFNDAGDLGQALKTANGAGFLNQEAPSGGKHANLLGQQVPNTKTIRQMLADMLVQYAGALALNKVNQSMVAPGSGAADVRQGVLGYGGAPDSERGVLSVDLSTNLWSDGKAGVSPIEGQEFRQAFFKDAAGTSFTDALKALGFKSAADLAQKVWGAKDDSVIDRFDIAVGASGGTYSIAERAYPTDPWALTAQHVDIFVGTTGDDKVTGTSGGDILIGNGGKDHIDGGAGNDVIVATGGRDAVTVGGFGQDRILNTSAEGIIWGDVEGSWIDKASGNRFYLDPKTKQVTQLYDAASNSDLFTWAPNTKIIDAQKVDRLNFAGIPIIGGTDDGGMSFSGLLFGAVGAVIAKAQSALTWTNTVYFDSVNSFISYRFEESEDGKGGYDLLIGSVFSALYDAAAERLGINPGQVDFWGLGEQRIDEYVTSRDVQEGAIPFTYFSSQLSSVANVGKLGLVFKKANPKGVALSYWQALDPFYATAAGGANVAIIDQAQTSAFYSHQYATAMKCPSSKHLAQSWWRGNGGRASSGVGF